jgi:hypothetical protein
MIWHTITNIIFACFIFGELKMFAKNAKIRLPRKKRIYGIHPDSVNLDNVNLETLKCCEGMITSPVAKYFGICLKIRL